MEFWTNTVGMPDKVAATAAEYEERGWDGLGVPYAPTMAPDPYVCLAAAAMATEKLQVATWVATPASHTPASAAGSMKTVQAVSNGRSVLTIGRGDSALAYLGMAPAPLKFFEAYIARLANYLRDIPQPFDLDLDGGNHFPPVASLGLAQAPEDAKFGLFMRDIAPVPLDMVATGPKVLGIAARHADRISLAVGAERERVAWAMREAKAAREFAGIDRSVSYAAWVPLIVTNDLDAGREQLAGGVASMARFTSMHGKAVAPVSDADKEMYEKLHDAYQMGGHFRKGSPQSKVLTAEFIDRFAIVGPPEHCIERLNALAELGVERFIIDGASPDRSSELTRHSMDLFAREVIPALR